MDTNELIIIYNAPAQESKVCTIVMSRKLFSLIGCVIAMLMGLALTYVSALCGYTEANGIFIWPALLGMIVFVLFLNMFINVIINTK